MLNLEVLALQTLSLILFLPGNTISSDPSDISMDTVLEHITLGEASVPHGYSADESGNLLLDNELESYEQVVDGMELQSMVNGSEEVEAEGRDISGKIKPNIDILYPNT
ncbi:uncharacterized protein F5147DRAFT_778061 [Suillus discolor]|uniref:Uncharacterized protein n=1 Tax=Suillus discolor TaxID=1912936 RepID=A0A9P7JPL3_9AGAM|nr:uncharacterized protein F5147DRAFT_778061 [Suillus discolor]KAG2097258.1 hypothetical protein F5147DRAFT_778061 [Suillus discolor]